MLMDAEQVGAELERILGSKAFADAERAKRFLRFVVTRAVEGRKGEIKESVIAIEALGRSSSFDSKTDPVVRVEARRLRDRLTSYYEIEGKSDPVVIALPKGGYVPEFHDRRPRAFAIGPVFGIILVGLVAVIFGWMYWPGSPRPPRLLRLSVLPPEGSPFESFAVSPDGCKIAFTSSLRGVVMLWVRSLETGEAKALGGTENASYPFWSPDSKTIGFHVPSRLKTIDVGGGPARDLAAVIVGRGADWGRTGVIAFALGPGVLYRIMASGGAPQPITSLDTARGEVAHGMPHFLPDGRHFLYLAMSSRRGESSIRVGSLDSKESKVLLKADTSAAFAPLLSGRSGALLFVHDGALTAQRFDTARLELSGERTVVVPQIRYRRWFHSGFSVSANGLLIYQSGSPEDHQLTWVDRDGKVLSEIGPRNRYSAFTLSPDGRRLAILRNDDPDTALNRIWMMDLSHGGAISRLDDAEHSELEFAPIWSVKSGELLFSRGSGNRMRLLRQPLNDGTAQQVLDTDGPKWTTDWSADGRFLVYNSQWPDYRNMHVWLVQLGGADGAKPHPILNHAHNEMGAVFSPTSERGAPRWIAYSSDETGRFEVYVRTFPAGEGRWRVSTGGGALPRWRPDGRELFYLASDGKLMATTVHPSTTFEFDTPHALFETPSARSATQALMNQYAISRDGQRFLLNRRLPDPGADAITAVVPW
jgi:Tol biopolymer transport system component